MDTTQGLHNVPSQKFEAQSLETAGFQARNWLREILLSLTTELQVSPLATTSHLLQLAGWPVCVGAGAVGLAAEVAELVVDGLPLTVPVQYA